MFASYTAILSRALLSADPDLANPPKHATHEASGAHLDKDTQQKLTKLAENLSRYEENFGRHLKILLDALNYYAATETVVLLGLCARLSTAGEGGFNERGEGGDETVM